MKLDRILLVPGLIEPPIMMWPLRRFLAKRFDRVELWRDRMVFRSLQNSVDRLSEAIAGCEGERIGVVTHSFGDWVTRHAIEQASDHRVVSLVSVTPVMRSGFLTSLAHAVSGNLIPEIEVIADRDRASRLARKDLGVPRLVLWAKVDECVRRIELPDDANVREEDFVATHLTIIVQPNVHRRIAKFLADPTIPVNDSERQMAF